MKTRKQLQAENTQLRAQLDVHTHVTRIALNTRIVDLKMELQDMTKRCETAEAEVAKLREVKAPAKEA
jgi:hypothetical protein